MPFLLILNLYTRHLSISHYLMLISNGHTGEVAHEEFLLGQSIQGARVYLYPHLHFSIGYNGPQVSTIDPISSPSSASIIKVILISLYCSLCPHSHLCSDCQRECHYRHQEKNRHHRSRYWTGDRVFLFSRVGTHSRNQLQA
jgi:hypothetical protein